MKSHGLGSSISARVAAAKPRAATSQGAPGSATPRSPGRRTGQAPSVQQAAVAAALARPAWVIFQNSAGGREYLYIRPQKPSKGQIPFHVRVGTSHLTISISQQLPHPRAALARALDLFTQLPQTTRYPVQTLQIEASPDPYDAYFQAKYHDPSLVGGSSAQGQTVSIWHAATNLFNLHARRLDHEIGHLIGQARSQDHTFCPPGWYAAIKSDGAGNTVSAYAKESPDEDFAESWSYYILARQSGAQQLAAFRQKFPDRARLLDAIYADVVSKAPRKS